MNEEEIVKGLRWMAKVRTVCEDSICECRKCEFHRFCTDPDEGESLGKQSDWLTEAASLIESLRAQLSESQRREKAAVADLEYACGSSGEFELRSICDICRRKQTDGTCPTQCEMNSLAASNKWEWRGPQADGKGE